MAKKSWAIGHVLAPWPFVVFGVLLVAGAAVLWPMLGAARAVMAAFDLAALAFLLACVPLFRRGPEQMRATAARNDANRGSMLLIAAVVTLVILVAVAGELMQKGRPHPRDVALLLATLCLCWLFSTMVYALHYAHAYYVQACDGGDAGGLKFPDTDEPDYWDFAYFSTCLAMTFQTSDVNICSRGQRRTVMFHSLGAFVFNIGIIAFSINILGSS